MAFGALSSGISALRSFAKGMEVIGNNIANVNTVSFKGSRIKYSETFNQVLQQSAPHPSDGSGSNVPASQVGLGVQVEGVVGMFHQGGLTSTSQPTDLAISGEGFFLVKDARNNNKAFATRGGDFRIDDRGFLVTSEGYNVQGLMDGSIGFEVSVNGDGEWEFVPNTDSLSGTIAPQTYGAIRIDYNKQQAEVEKEVYDNASQGARNAVSYTNDLISRDIGGTPIWGSVTTSGGVITAYNYGAASPDQHRVGAFTFDDPANPTEITGATGWHAFMEQAVNDLIALRNKSLEGERQNIVSDAKIRDAVSSDFFYRMFQADPSFQANLASNGGVVNLDGNAVQKLMIDDANLTWPATIDEQGTINAVMGTFPTNFTEAEQIMQEVRADKTPDLSRFSIDAEGTVRYFLDNGDSFIRGQIQLVSFNDNTALIREGRNLYSGFGAAGLKEETASNPDGMQVAGRNGLGVIQQGALELSNVDLTNEFAQMITTQRGFQAGSRIITVSDDILQEVVNLKR